MELVEEDDKDPWAVYASSVAEQDVLVRREGEDTWTVVNWQLSRHNGRWLTDSLSIN